MKKILIFIFLTGLFFEGCTPKKMDINTALIKALEQNRKVLMAKDSLLKMLIDASETRNVMLNENNYKEKIDSDSTLDFSAIEQIKVYGDRFEFVLKKEAINTLVSNTKATHLFIYPLQQKAGLGMVNEQTVYLISNGKVANLWNGMKITHWEKVSDGFYYLILSEETL